MDGKGPIYMRTEEAIEQHRRQQYARREGLPRRSSRSSRSEAWEDFLDMTISQAILWAATNVAARREVLGDRGLPSPTSSARTPALPAHGSAVRRICRPTKPSREYFWGYANMTTVKGMFCAGDAPALPATSSLPARTPKGASPPRPPSSSSSKTTTAPKVDAGAIWSAQGRES